MVSLILKTLEALRKSTRSKSASQNKGKLIDITSIRSRFAAKMENAVRFSKTALSEAICQFDMYKVEEEAFFARFEGC